MKNLKSIVTVCFLFLLLPAISLASEVTGELNPGQENIEAQPSDLEAVAENPDSPPAGGGGGSTGGSSSGSNNLNEDSENNDDNDNDTSDNNSNDNLEADDVIGTPEVKGVSEINILNGDIIQCKTSDNPFAVYIVKEVGDTKYIRHIVSLEIFNYYGHLNWENLKQVESLDSYSLSGWVRHNTGPNGTAGPTDKVYEINGDQTKHWINMTAEDFLTHGGSDAATFSVNQGELDLYKTGADVMML